MNRAVIDTNVLIGWYKAGAINQENLDTIAPVFSIITKIEALGFGQITKIEENAIIKMLNTGELIYIDSSIAQQTIVLRQKLKIKMPDAIIAATALLVDAELWTANISDFNGIEGLKLYNPIK